jgi:hypothetical protein
VIASRCITLIVSASKRNSRVVQAPPPIGHSENRLNAVEVSPTPIGALKVLVKSQAMKPGSPATG